MAVEGSGPDGGGPRVSGGSSADAASASGPDPLAADRRTMLVALVAMVALIAVGVVSASIFASSACDDVVPSVTSPGPAGADPEAVLESAGIGGDERAAVLAALQDVADELGPLSGLAVVDGAQRLLPTDAGPVAAGATTSLLDTTGTEVVASVEIADGIVAGSGDALLSLARVNDLTGQVDAFASIDTAPGAALERIGCVDTATVGTPLAFELDAAEGDALLFRSAEDGDDAELERRDPRTGRLWFARVDVGVAPAGVTGERIDARLGTDIAALVRRTAPDQEVPVVTAVDAGDGTPRWTLDRDGFALVPPAVEMTPLTASAGAHEADEATAPPLATDEPQRVEILALDHRLLLIALTPARSDAEVAAGGTAALGPSVGPGAVVAIDPADGELRWSRPLAAGTAVTAAAGDGTGGGWLRMASDGEHRLLQLDEDGATSRTVSLADGGGPLPLHRVGLAVDRDAAAPLPLFAAFGGALAVATDESIAVLEGTVAYHDVLIADDHVVVLIGPDPAEAADARRLAATFVRP